MNNVQFEYLCSRLTAFEEKLNNVILLQTESNKLLGYLSDKAMLTGDAAEEFSALRQKVAALTDEMEELV